MFQRMRQQLAINANNNLQFNKDINEYLKDGIIDGIDDYNELRMTASPGATRIASSPTVVVKTPEVRQGGIVNLARHKDFGFNMGNDTDQISSYRQSSLAAAQSQQQQNVSQSIHNEPVIKPFNFVVQKKTKEQQNVAAHEEDSDVSIEHKAPQVLKMKRSLIEKSQQEESSYSEEDNYKVVEQRRREARQAKQQRREKQQRQQKSRRQHREPSSDDTISSIQNDRDDSFEEYDYYQPRPAVNQNANAPKQQHTNNYQHQQVNENRGENYTTININKNTRGPNAVKTLTVQKVKRSTKDKQSHEQAQDDHRTKSRQISESLAPNVELQEKKKRKDVSFSEKLEKSISDVSEQQNVPGPKDPTNSQDLLQRIEEEGHRINDEFHEEINLEPIGLTVRHNNHSHRSKSKENYASRLDINDLNAFNNSVDDNQFDLPVYQEPMDINELAIQQENEQRRRRISTEDEVSNLQLTQIVHKQSKESREQKQMSKQASRSSKKTTSAEAPVKQQKKRQEHAGEKQIRQKRKVAEHDDEGSFFLSSDEEMNSSIQEEYDNLADTQSQSFSIPRKSRINLIKTAQVEASAARAADELTKELFEFALEAAANQTDLLNKKLATYTTPFEERELVTIKLKDGALRRRRISIRKILGEDIIYSNGQAVQLKLCFINNEIHDMRKINAEQVKKPFPQRFPQNLRKIDPKDDSEFIFEKNKRNRSINPITRFEKYDFKQMAPGCYKAGISQVDKRQQEIITIENGNIFDKQRYNQTINLLQASGESEITLQGVSKQSYKLRQYDSFVVPSGVQFSIKQLHNKTSVLILSSTVEYDG